MLTSIRTELLNYTLDAINDGVINEDNYEDRHYHLFNEDYYIIGYYQANEWLKGHNIDPFEAIATVVQWEELEYGYVTLKSADISSESIVNMLVYILGGELLSEFNYCDTVEELAEAVKEELA